MEEYHWGGLTATLDANLAICWKLWCIQLYFSILKLLINKWFMYQSENQFGAANQQER